MKKRISLILALVILVGALAGCGGSANKDDVKGQINNPSTAPETSPSVNEPAASAEPDGKEIELGDIANGAVYSNDFAGLKFNLPEGWVFADEEQLLAIMNVGAEMIYGEDSQALVDYAADYTVYDMMAASPDGTQNVMVMFENVNRNVLVGMIMTPDTYLDAIEKELGSVTDFTYKIEGRSNVTLCGKDYRCLSTSIAEYPVYQDYYVRREGNYMIILSFTGTQLNPASSMTGYFA